MRNPDDKPENADGIARPGDPQKGYANEAAPIVKTEEPNDGRPRIVSDLPKVSDKMADNIKANPLSRDPLPVQVNPKNKRSSAIAVNTTPVNDSTPGAVTDIRHGTLKPNDFQTSIGVSNAFDADINPHLRYAPSFPDTADMKFPRAPAIQGYVGDYSVPNVDSAAAADHAKADATLIVSRSIQNLYLSHHDFPKD